MEVLENVIQFAAMGVSAWGAGLAIVGIINFSEGHSQQNAARKEEGMGKIIGGAVIFIVGSALVPQITNLIHDPTGSAAGSIIGIVNRLINLR